MDEIKNNEIYLRRKEALTSFFSDKEYLPLTFKQIASVFEVPKQEYDLLKELLEELELDGLILLDDSKRYVSAKKEHLIKCVYEAKSANFGFGIINGREDIYISGRNANTAMDKDLVLVKLITGGYHAKEGVVVKILKRAPRVIIGKFFRFRNFGFVEPMDKKIPEIYIPKKYCSLAEHSDYVEVEIEKHAEKNLRMEGKILRVIGNNNTPNVEVKALYLMKRLDELESFSEEVQKELESIPDKVKAEELVGRKDRRDDMVVTIDSQDAMDLDDAVSVKKLENGNYLLSVYIADVSHYVKENTALDKEAIDRGTSIYIPGTVLPMLPKKLSNGICSLNALEDRLALGVDMEIDSEGKVVASDIFKAIICVRKKMTYDKVYCVLCDEKVEGYEPFKDFLLLMKELAQILNQQRREKGSIHFDLPELKVELNADGSVLEIKPSEKTIAHNMIEEFMLITNMVVAERFFFLDVPFIYRVHETPDEEKLRELNEVLENYHKRIKGVKNIHPKVLADLLEDIQDEDEKQVISSYVLRTLKLARYSNKCLGHFGLAARYYCHFTSPIRRYPDLFIHRMISKCLEQNYGMNQEEFLKYDKEAEKYAKSSSDAEKNATLIERDFDDLYVALYMSKRIDEEFHAIITSVTSFGVFVKLDNLAEGLVPIYSIFNNEFASFDEKRRIIFGERSKEVFKVGDHVKVRLTKVDIRLKQIDFVIVEHKG